MGKRVTSTRTRKRQPWKQKELKSGDVIIQHDEAHETDIVIPVMGPTGVGKSTFINALLGSPQMQVGHDLKSCTNNLQHAYINDIPKRPTFKGRRIVIVDTPGFDDTYSDDGEILRRISVWLASSYDADMTLGGVIYLHDISQTRMLGTTRKNFDMFRKLCGDGAAASVILGTTKWGEVHSEVGERREGQLINTYWREMTDRKSRVRRFDNTHKSAWDIVYCILDTLGRSEMLQIQNELVNLQEIIPETEAGKTLRYTLQQLLEMQKQTAERLAAHAAGGDDAEAQKKLEEHWDKMRTTLKQIKDLKISISLRVTRFLGLR